jgi:hypothetical protein
MPREYGLNLPPALRSQNEASTKERRTINQRLFKSENHQIRNLNSEI